jgi:hypothetical protein
MQLSDDVINDGARDSVELVAIVDSYPPSLNDVSVFG